MVGNPRPIMRRTSSVSLIGSGSVSGDSSPMPEHLKEKQKSSNYVPPASTPRQVIGFHPKVCIDEDLDLPMAIPPHPHPPQARSPTGSPRSGLGDLLAGPRRWERKDEGVGLGIVAALSSSQEDIDSGREESRGCAGPRKTSPQSHLLPSVFAPSRASPPVPNYLPSNSGYPCSSRCSHHDCGPLAFGTQSLRPESMLTDGSHRGEASSRRNSSTNAAAWSMPNASGGAPVLAWADMEVDQREPFLLAPPPAVVRLTAATPAKAGFTQNFLDACHLCRRRLGEGRDIYIYRGDRAFCSPECRLQQIANDERPSKCSSAVMKMGGTDVRNTSQRSRVITAGTAAAA